MPYFFRPNFIAPVMLLVFLTGTVSAQTSTVEHALEAEFQGRIAPLIHQYCVDCHNADLMKSGVRVDRLVSTPDDRQLFLWKEILKQVADGTMPPKGERQPSAAERDAILAWIPRAMNAASARNLRYNGSTRRLTVSQYRNTLRDLLASGELSGDLLSLLVGAAAVGIVVDLAARVYFQLVEHNVSEEAIGMFKFKLVSLFVLGIPGCSIAIALLVALALAAVVLLFSGSSWPWVVLVAAVCGVLYGGYRLGRRHRWFLRMATGAVMTAGAALAGGWSAQAYNRLMDNNPMSFAGKNDDAVAMALDCRPLTEGTDRWAEVVLYNHSRHPLAFSLNANATLVGVGQVPLRGVGDGGARQIFLVLDLHQARSVRLVPAPGSAPLALPAGQGGEIHCSIVAEPVARHALGWMAEMTLPKR